MLPRCFVHGFHGVRHLPDADRATRTVPGVVAPHRRPDVAGLAIVLLAAITVFATLILTGCDGPDHSRSATVPAPSPILPDDMSGLDFDALLLDEFP